MRNRKKAVIWGLCVVFAAILIAGMVHYTRLPEFRIMHSYSMSYTMKDGIQGRNTDLDVIVYKNRNDPDLYKRIEYEHNRINGEPTELKIRLFKSRNDIIKGREPYQVIVIDYRNDTVEIRE